jgi:hypothetical protein
MRSAIIAWVFATSMLFGAEARSQGSVQCNMPDLVTKWFVVQRNSATPHVSAQNLYKSFQALSQFINQDNLYPQSDFGDGNTGPGNRDWFRQNLKNSSSSYFLNLMFVAGASISPPNTSSKPCYVCPVQPLYNIATVSGFPNICPLDLLNPQYDATFWGGVQAAYNRWQTDVKNLTTDCSIDPNNCQANIATINSDQSYYNNLVAGFTSLSKHNCNVQQVQMDMTSANCTMATLRTFVVKE